MSADQRHDSAEIDAGLIRCWGVAHDVRDDGFVNPSRVTYAISEEYAIRNARQFGGTPVTRLVTEWTTVTPPVGGES